MRAMKGYPFEDRCSVVALVQRARFAKAVYDPWWKIWEDAGWVSMGRSRNLDWMHIQAARV